MIQVMLVANASSSHTIRWANAIVSKGFDVVLVTQHEVMNGLVDEVRVEKLPFKNKLGYFLNVFSLKNLYRKYEPDFVHAYFASGYGALLANSSIDYYLSVWGSDVYLYPNQSLLNKVILKRSLRKASNIFSTSYAMKKETNKYTSKCIHVIPFGVDVSRYYINKQEDNTVVIGIAKVLDDIYGIDVLIRAFERIYKSDEGQTNIRLHIAGDGPAKSKLEGLVHELGISGNVKFLGWISFEELPRFYASLDIFCVPSYSESFGVVAVEAGASYLPSVVSNVGGLPEVVVDGETGFVSEPGDITDFSEKLLKLVKSPNLRDSMGKKARLRVENEYVWNENVEEMCGYYRGNE